MLFDRSRLQDVLKAYKSDFKGEHWEDEKYKWIAVKHFQDHWDIDAPDFAAMLKEALGKTGNLLVSAGRFPRGMIEEFAEVAPDRVRQMFEELFDESRDIWSRVEAFKKSSPPLLVIHGKNAKNHYQDENTIFTYLWLRYPDKYYIYKISEIRRVAAELRCPLVFKNGKYEANIRNFLELYDAIRQELLADRELKGLLKSQLTADCYPDDALCTLTVDVGYYISRKYGKAEPDEEEKRPEVVPVAANPNHWWLNANPKYWSFSEIATGEVQSYTLYSDSGHKRRIFQNFLDAKTGDIVIGYESTPVKQITSIARITKPQDGKNLYFQKVEALRNPIPLDAFKDAKALSGMECFVNPQGSLFKLTSDEYDFLMDIIREENPVETGKHLPPYGKAELLREVFIAEDKYDSLVRVLKTKLNIILQGAPGVGKTFVAKRLAYSIMGEKDDSRVEVVQFHQSYSYEDFVMGYKPNADGFVLRYGVFYKFCQRAASDPGRAYFFIIDEINRGNLSKIFGELLMLIEKDYRGTSLRLAYNELAFNVPKNLYIIGMMNTADRSLAMIDYALRRRFSFFDMAPGFDSDGFIAYQRGLNSKKLDRLIETIRELNREIAEDKSLGKGFCIGHSYLCGAEKCSDEWLRGVVEYDILPMLAEYWFDDPEKYDIWEKRLTDAVK